MDSRGLVQFSSVQSLSHVWFFVTPWTAARQASLSTTNSQSLFKLMSIELVMPYNHLIFHCSLLFLPSIFSSIRAFSNESVSHIRWPKYIHRGNANSFYTKIKPTTADERKKVLVCQLCPTLCNPVDCSPSGSSINGISQARILEWVAISFSGGSSQPRDPTWVSCIAGGFFTIWVTREVSLLMKIQPNSVIMCKTPTYINPIKHITSCLYTE